MVDNGIKLVGQDWIDEWTSHSIDQTNTVNGLPVVYLTDLSGIVVPTDAGQVIIANCTDVVVQNQEIMNATRGITAAHCRNVTLYNNSCSGCSEYGVYLTQCVNSSISKCNASGNGQGIYLHSVTDSHVTESSCLQNVEDGVHLYYSSQVTVANCTCNANGINGILVVQCDSLSLHSNTCQLNQVGIKVTEGGGYVVEGNSLSENAQYGMHLDSSNCRIAYNTITDNMVYGIHVWGGYGNEVVNNLIAHNSNYGIFVNAYASENCICNNTFVGNNGSGIQAYDDGSNNRWNISGTPHGYGNYWSDWTSPDSEPDGIVDYPYLLDGSAGAMDHHPLATMPTEPIPEFGMIPLAVMALIVVILIVGEERRRKT
jgi:parallel beta-helix repeat protein